MPFRGETIFQRIFDLGGTVDLAKARLALSDLINPAAVEAQRARPEYVSFAAPLLLDLAPLNLDLALTGGVSITAAARLYEVGALAITLRVPTVGESLADIAQLTQASFSMRGRPARRTAIFQAVVDALRPQLKTALDEIFDVPVDPETYSAFCFTEVPDGAEQIWKYERNRIAALLIAEPNPDRLAPSEVDELLKNYSRYYIDDLVVADWDAALVIEPGGKYEDLLYIFEVANLELLVLRKYDHYLDRFLERIYTEHDQLFRGKLFTTGRAKDMLRELSEVRVDLARVQDELDNTAKFFGDWYVARVYMGLEAKLHIRDYQDSVTAKLTTLRDLYQSVQSEIEVRQSLALEIAIVLLIVFEIVMAFVTPH